MEKFSVSTKTAIAGKKLPNYANMRRRVVSNMKKYINNKLYNTDTATELGSWSNGCYGNDFARENESLYRKQSGEFFLYGGGGPLSKYAVNHGNETSGSERIRPLTYEQAEQWAIENLTADEHDSIFGAIKEDTTRSGMMISLSGETRAKVKREATMRGTSVSAVIESLINSHLTSND